MADTSGIKAGRAYIELGVGDKLTSGLKHAQARLKAFGVGVRNVGLGVAGLGMSIASPMVTAAKSFAHLRDVAPHLTPPKFMLIALPIEEHALLLNLRRRLDQFAFASRPG